MTVPSGEFGVPAAVVDQERACHDVLVRFAGRLPDRLLWRLREWLAAGAHQAVAVTLPKSLVRHRVAVTDYERDLLEASLLHWGAPGRSLDAVLPVDELAEVAVTFAADLAPDALCADLAGGGWRDRIDLTLIAVLRGRTDAMELRRGWRMDRPRPRRVVLAYVDGNVAGDLPGITATLQRVLRAHGDLTPCVEVVHPGLALGPYHRAALRESVSLWRARHAEVSQQPQPRAAAAVHA